MRIVVAAYGKLRSSHIRREIDKYIGRLGKYTSLEVREIKEQRAGGDSSKARTNDDSRFLKTLKDDDYLILCDERGKQPDSTGLAEILSQRERSGRGRTIFLVGGAYGVGTDIRERADMLLGLSRLTLPHELARLVLIEAIYRGFTIQRGEKYHHE